MQVTTSAHIAQYFMLKYLDEQTHRPIGLSTALIIMRICKGPMFGCAEICLPKFTMEDLGYNFKSQGFLGLQSSCLRNRNRKRTSHVLLIRLTLVSLLSIFWQIIFERSLVFLLHSIDDQSQLHFGSSPAIYYRSEEQDLRIKNVPLTTPPLLSPSSLTLRTPRSRHKTPRRHFHLRPLL
jgi:hypothetical protein